jgi:crossover junction endodeoxyribonuclease RuvC
VIPVLGLDLSLTSTGVAVVSVGGDIATWTVTTGTARGVPRQQHILNAIRDAVALHKPGIVAIEGIYVGHNTNTLPLAELHGIVKFWLHNKRPYVLVPPALLKLYATGKGNAGKDAVLLETERRLGRLTQVVDNNGADALWLAAMARDQYGAPLAPMPQAHRAALTKIVWPVLGRPDNPPTPGGGAAINCHRRPRTSRYPDRSVSIP